MLLAGWTELWLRQRAEKLPSRQRGGRARAEAAGGARVAMGGGATALNPPPWRPRAQDRACVRQLDPHRCAAGRGEVGWQRAGCDGRHVLTQGIPSPPATRRLPPRPSSACSAAIRRSWRSSCLWRRNCSANQTTGAVSVVLGGPARAPGARQHPAGRALAAAALAAAAACSSPAHALSLLPLLPQTF